MQFLLVVAVIVIGLKIGAAANSFGLVCLTVAWAGFTYWSSRDEALRFLCVPLISFIAGGFVVLLSWGMYCVQTGIFSQVSDGLARTFLR